MRRLPTFSKLDLAARCTFPWTSGITWPKVERPNAYRGIGRAMSDAARCLAVLGDYPHAEIVAAHELTPADARKLQACALHVRELLNEEAETDRWRCAEVALAFDLATGQARELQQEHERDYSGLGRTECGGRFDLVRMRSDGVVVLRDWKMGRYTWGHRPGEAFQMRAYGLSVARAYGTSSVLVEYAQVDDDGIRRTADLLDEFELAVIAAELRQLYERVSGAPEPPKQGAWCRDAYCPILAVCPATRNTMAEVAQAAELRFPLTIEFQGPEHVAYALERLEVAKAVLDTIREAAKEWARANGPVPMASGKLWGAVQHDGKESIDLSVDGAVEAIEQYLGPFAVASAIERKTSKSALETTAKKLQTARGEGVKATRALFDRLRELGALKRGAPYEAFEEFTPQPAAQLGE